MLRSVFVKAKKHEWRMDAKLVYHLKKAKRRIKSNWDFVFCVCGIEGSGKSIFAHQIAKFCDPSYNIDRCVFTPEDFMDKVLHANKYQAIVFDEAARGLASKNTMSRTNKILEIMMMEVRARNLFIIIVMPSPWDLSKYVMLHRNRGLFHVKTDKYMRRGFFDFYDRFAVKRLITHGTRDRNWNVAKSILFGRFVNYAVLDVEEYNKKKSSQLQLMLRDVKKGEEPNPWKDRFSNVLWSLYNNKTTFKFTQADLADLCGVSTALISKCLKEKQQMFEAKSVRIK